VVGGECVWIPSSKQCERKEKDKKSEKGTNFPWWIFLLVGLILLIIAVLIILFILYKRKKKKKEDDKKEVVIEEFSNKKTPSSQVDISQPQTEDGIIDECEHLEETLKKDQKEIDISQMLEIFFFFFFWL
jgi:flagellar biosynthesis/type III secretory pathway M-ring protein FliF/YscJ